MTDTNGIVEITYDYDEFGNIISEEAVETSVSTLAPSMIGKVESAEENVGIIKTVINNPYRYAGYEYIEEIGIYDLNARYYNPEIARFLSADPYYNLGNRVIGLYEINVPTAASIMQANNLYVYCGNNPVLLVDLLGLDAILINKPVDNAANKVGVEHMGAFFQDEDDNWWFFFWGGDVKYVMVDDNSIFDSLEKINEWLVNYTDENNPKFELLNKEYPYRDSVYIKGNFTASHTAALQLKNAFDTENWSNTSFIDIPFNFSNGNILKIENRDYNLLTNNCSQVTMRLFMLGILPDCTSVAAYLARNGYGTNVIPNINMNNMQSVFYNKATNLSGFEKAIQEQRNRYQNKWEWVQWLFYRDLKSNIETISPSV